MERQADTLREDDDDFTQAGALVRDVWNDEQRAAVTLPAAPATETTIFFHGATRGKTRGAESPGGGAKSPS